MASVPVQPSPTSGLVTRFARILDKSGLLAAALRVSEETARKISPLQLKSQKGAVYRGDLNQDGLSGFAELHPVQEIVERRNLEVREALSRLSAGSPGQAFAGMFPLDTGLSAGRIIRDEAHGAILLIDGHSLQLLAESIRLFCEFFVAPARIDAGSLLTHFSKMLEDHVREAALQHTTGKSRVFFAPPMHSAIRGLIEEIHAAYHAFLGKPQDVRSAIWTNIANACVRFVIAHEYGHLLSDQDGGARLKGEEAEFAADRWAVRLLFAHAPATSETGPPPNPTGASKIESLASLCAPTTLRLAAAVIQVDAVIHGRKDEPSATVMLLTRRYQALAEILASEGDWRDDELAVAALFND